MTAFSYDISAPGMLCYGAATAKCRTRITAESRRSQRTGHVTHVRDLTSTFAWVDHHIDASSVYTVFQA